MPIQFRCTNCQAVLRAPSDKSGARAKCKKCGSIMKIPEPASARRVAKPESQTPVVSTNTMSLEGEPNFDELGGQLPTFLAAQRPRESSAREPGGELNSTAASSADDPFANLPEFQTLQAPVERKGVADEEFHKMMMNGDQATIFSSQQAPTAQPSPQPAAPMPVPDHGDIAGVIGNFDDSIQQAVQKQRAADERAVRAKFTVGQIQTAFKKPIGKVERLRGLRRKQMRSALLTAMVPIGFLAAVAFGSLFIVFLIRTQVFGGTSEIVNPLIGLPLVVASIVMLFCWIPAFNLVLAGGSLLFLREQHTSATQLTRESQPVMYEFVDQICDKLGAPKPCRIDLDCDFNASASLRKGWFSSGKRDLVLTIGIPLIAVQNTEQLASVIAHEFGHFRQGSAMKTYYVIQRLTQWFVMSAQTGIGYFYWFGYLTHMISGSLSRDMEWDADRHAVHLAGTKAFTESSAQLERYGVAYAVTLQNLLELYHNGVLVDNIPRLMLHIGRTMPASVIRRIAEETEKQRLDQLDSHPPTRDRVNAARDLNQPGILSLGRPSTDLIDHWKPLCTKITMDFYTEKLNLAPNEIQHSHLTPLEDLLRDEHKLLLDLAEKEK